MDKNHGPWDLGRDVILTLITGGLWIIVIGIREIAKIARNK